jgi:hypothetical protein
VCGKPEASGRASSRPSPRGPPNAEAICGHHQEVALGADAFEKHHQSALEQLAGIEGRPTPVGRGITDPLPNTAEVEPALQVTGDVVAGNQAGAGNGHGHAEVTGLGEAEQGRSPQPPGDDERPLRATAT